MTLLTALQGGFGDSGDALRIDGRTLSREQLLGAATAVADRVAGAPALAVLARPTAACVAYLVEAFAAPGLT
ncbi:acyl-CoA synthetase, partial [Kitasatospora sp. NPDC001574]